MASPYSTRHSRHNSENRDSYSNRSRDRGYSYTDYSYTPSPSTYSYSTRTAEPVERELPSRRRSQRHARTDTVRKKRWPPAPSVEDELDYLRRKFGSTALSDDVKSQASMRGIIEQEPIMIELEQPNAPEPFFEPYPHLHDERRFVLVSDPAKAPPSSTSTPYTTRGRDTKQRAPLLDTHLNDPPVRLQRERSPYSYSKPSAQSSSSGTAGEGLLSPEAVVPSKSSYSRPARTERENKPKESSRFGGDTLSSRDAEPGRRPGSRGGSDLEAEKKDADTVLLRRKPSRYSFTPGDSSPKAEPERVERRSERRASPRSSKTWPSRSDSPDSTSSENPPTPPPRPNASKTHLDGLPIRTSSKQPCNMTGSSHSGSSHSRPASPRVSEQHSYVPNPSRSPNPQDQSSRHGAGTRPRSRTNPRPPSPLAMPSMPDKPTLPPRTESNNYQRAATPSSPYTEGPPSSPLERSRPPSRHSQQVRHESMHVPPRIDVQSPSPARPANSNSLPYPVDEMIATAAMPAVATYQMQSPTEIKSPTHSLHGSRNTPTHRDTSSNLEKPNLASRPRSTSTSRPHDSTSSNLEQPKFSSRPRSTSNSRSQAPRDLVATEPESRPKKFSTLLMEPMKPCPRPEPSSRHDDWYSLEGYPSFAICPHCLDSIFGDTRFLKEFKRSYRRSASTRIKCDFSSPWMRIAWLMTLQQERKDLDLIYRLARVADIGDSCPDEKEIYGTWYGLLDPYGTWVSGFYVCPHDVLQIEALFPTLKGALTRIPHQEFKSERYLCSLRVNTGRFAGYLDLLIEVDAKARERRGKPDMRPFIQLARDNSFRSECPRDALVEKQAWHFMLALPEFTVCEECYDEIVWPAIDKGAKIGDEFNRTMQYIPDEHLRGGTSCQLYSSRMRKVWKIALEEDDWGYLFKKARERAQVEMELQAEQRSLLRLLEVAKRQRGRTGSDEDLLLVKEQLTRLARDWKKFE